jgi:hypothetical protein
MVANKQRHCLCLQRQYLLPNVAYLRVITMLL